MGSLQLLSNDPTEDLFEKLLLPLYVCAECVVEHRLIVAPTLILYLGAEPIYNVTIKSNGDPNFFPRRGKDGPTFIFTKIIFHLHIVSPHSAQPCVRK